MLGGIKAVTWTDVQQMCIIFAGPGDRAGHRDRAAAADRSPSATRYTWRARRAGSTPSTTNFDWNDRFNIWSGLIGGTFLFLSYFGCDQSQVQRYLTGKSIAQSRLSLLFNAVAKIPMQFFILFIGAMVFVFYLFVQPPVLFHQVAMARIRSPRSRRPSSSATIARSIMRKSAASDFVEARHCTMRTCADGPSRSIAWRKRRWTDPLAALGAVGAVQRDMGLRAARPCASRCSATREASAQRWA